MLPFATQDWMENIPLYATEAYFNMEELGDCRTDSNAFLP